ncbi:MAG: MFS transporter [Salibacteraceae bacterium]
MVPASRIYTRTFWLLCASSVLFFASFNFIIAELPDFLTARGGAEYKGMIIWLFTVAALISRPFSGRLADRVGRLPVILVGVVVSLVAGLLYPVFASLWGFFLLRFLHGFSTGFKPTGTAAYLADIIPEDRRGEAMGILGLCNALGASFGPMLGSAVANYFSLDAMFYCSSGMAALSVAILMGLPESLKNRQRLQLNTLLISRKDIMEPRALAPFLAMLFHSYSFGLVLTVVPDLSTHLGIANKGALIAVSTLASMLVRIFAGRTSDRLGRTPVLVVGLLMDIIGFGLIAMAQTIPMVIIGLALYGFGMGINSPTILAWTVDLSQPGQRGRAIAFFYIGLELGIGFGALFSAWLHNSRPENFWMAFLSGSVFAAMGLVVVAFRKHLLPKN